MLGKHLEVLRNYESFELVKKDYWQRHGLRPSTAHAREIAAPFSHARSYFSSAREAEQTVKPLLLYYGVVSLSRGLALALSKGQREATLAQSHGLATKSWFSELSKPAPDFSALRIAATASGTLLDLDRATGHRSLLRGQGTDITDRVAFAPITNGFEVTLGDLLARIPMLQEHHWRWRGFSLCAPVKVTSEGGEVIVRVRSAQELPPITQNDCNALFIGSNCQFLREEGGRYFYKGRDDNASLPGLADWIRRDLLGIGELWLTAKYPQSPNISKITTLFILSYALGMLVRYHPTQWTALIRAQIGDAALPTIAAAVDMLEVEFPSVVVDFLIDLHRSTVSGP